MLPESLRRRDKRIVQSADWTIQPPPAAAMLIQISTHLIQEKNPPCGGFFSCMVGVRRFELRASWSRTKRATGCATPRLNGLGHSQDSFYIIMTPALLVKYEIAFAS